MESIERAIVVNASIAQAFEPRANVEGWPLFLKARSDVHRIDAKQFRLSVERGGREYESVAEISLLIPERRIAWRGVSGVESSGVVSFETLADGKAQVNLKMLYHPDRGWHHPDALAERLAFHPACFKEFIEKAEPGRSHD